MTRPVLSRRSPTPRPAEPTRRPPARRLAAAPFRRLPALPLLLAVLALFAVLSLGDAPPAHAQGSKAPYKGPGIDIPGFTPNSKFEGVVGSKHDVTTGITLSTNEYVAACEWTTTNAHTQLAEGASPEQQITAKGCAIIQRGSNAASKLTLTQTMLDNGGVVIIAGQWGLLGNREFPLLNGVWVPVSLPPAAEIGDTVWSATLNVQDDNAGSLGCFNPDLGKECSTTSVLSDDEFDYDGATYAVTSVFDALQPTAFHVQFDKDVTAALDLLTLYVDGTPLDLVSATHTTGNTWAEWGSADAGWAAGDTATLELKRTALWAATLTPKSLPGGALGCRNTATPAANKCTTTATLTDDDFELDGTTFAVTNVSVFTANKNFFLGFEGTIPDSLKGYTLRAGSGRFPLKSASISAFGGAESALWSGIGPTWTAGTAVPLSLVPTAPPGAPTGVVVAEEDRQLTVVWTAPDAGDSAITGYDVHYKHSSAPDAGPVIWSATLQSVQETSTGTFGCHDLVTGKECTAATGLTANEFAYNGVTYQVNSFTHDSTADYSLVRFNKSIPAGALESVQLVVVEGTDRHVLSIHTLLENSLPNDTMRFNGALDLSVGDVIKLELRLPPDPAAGWTDAGHTGTTASAVITGPPVWSATLTTKTVTNGIGCSNGDTGLECSTTSVLTDDSFEYNGVTYTITHIISDPSTGLSVSFDRDVTTALDAFTLHVGETATLALSSSTHLVGVTWAQWLDANPSWSAGDTVKLELRAANLKAFTSHDVRVRAKSSVGAGPWSAVASGTPTGPIRVRLNPTAYTAPEGAVARIFLEARDDHPDTDIVVTVTATPGTATAATDYAAGPWTVTFPAGVNILSFKVPLVADSVAEPGGETFTLTISPGDGYTVSGGPATVTIVDALWANDMDPKDLGSGNVGCDNAQTATANKCEPSTGSAIGDDDFVLDGTTYTISKISLNGGTLVITLDANVPGALEEGYALHVDGTKLDLDDAAVSGPTATWTNTGLTWQSVGATYVLSLQALPQAQTPWSATLTPQSLTGGMLGCNNALATASDKCTATATLSDDDFLIDGTVYSVAVVFVRSGRLGLGLTVNIPDALKTGYSLTVDGSKFALADASISGKLAQWTSNVPAWTAGTAVTLGMEPAVATPRIDNLVAGHEKLTVRYTLAAGTEAGKIRWRVKSPQGSWLPSDAGEALTAPSPHVITGLTNGETYQVQINAVKGAASSGWSAISEDAPEAASAPSAPPHLGLSARPNTITATWSVPARDGGADITGYDVQYKATAATGWTDVTHTGTGTTAEITGLTQGTGYDVRVRARNAVGAGPWSSVASATTGVVTVPGAVGVLSVGSGNGTLTVSWRPPASDGGADITGYDLEYKLGTATDQTASTPGDPNTGWVASALTSDTTSRVLTGLTNGVGYDVRVRAKNSAGAGPWSLRSLAPQAPTGERPRVRVATTAYTVAESAANVRVGIRLSIVPTSDVTVQVRTYDGTARAGEDFTGGPYTVTIPAYAWSADVLIPITSDSVPEGHEHFYVGIRQVPRVIPGRTVTYGGETYTIADTLVYDYFLGSPTTARVTIIDEWPDPRADDPYRMQLTPGVDRYPQEGLLRTPEVYKITASWTIPSPAPARWFIRYGPTDPAGPIIAPGGGGFVYPEAPITRELPGTATSFDMTKLDHGRHYSVLLCADYADGNYCQWNKPLVAPAGYPVPRWEARPDAVNGVPAISVFHLRDTSFPPYGGHVVQIRKAGTWDWEDWPEPTATHGLPAGVTLAGTGTSLGGRSRYTFEGLQSGFTYMVRVYAVTGGASPQPFPISSQEQRIVTWTKPGEPQNLDVTGGHKAGEIYVTWTPPADLGGHGAEVTGWDLQYVKSGSGSGWSTVPYLYPERARALITGLEPGASYDLRLRARNGLGEGPWATAMFDGQSVVPLPLPTSMKLNIDDDPQRTNQDGSEGWAFEFRQRIRVKLTLDRPAPAGGAEITFTRGGTATFGEDYSLEMIDDGSPHRRKVEDTFTVFQGEMTSTGLYITLYDDKVDEEDETIILNARSTNPELRATLTIVIMDDDAPPLQSPGPGIPGTPDGLTATAQVLGISTGHATDPFRHEMVMRWTPPAAEDGNAPAHYQTAWQRVFDDGATVQVMTEWQEQAEGEGVSDAEHTVVLPLTLDDRFNTFKPPLGGHRVGTDVSAHYHYDLTVRACNEAGCSAYAPVLTVRAAKPGEEVEVPQGQRQGPPEPEREPAGPPTPGQLEPYNVQVTPGDGTLTVTWNVAPRDGFQDDEIRHALRWSQVSGVWANPADPNAVGRNDGISVEGGVTSYTITGLQNGLATGVFVRSFTGDDRREGSAGSSQWVRLKGENTTPKAAQQQQAAKTYSVTATATATEGSNATLTITLSEAAPAGGVAFTVTAGYGGSSTATSSDVGSITSPVTVTEGSTTLDISIPTADDAVDEDDETFTVTVATAADGWEKVGDGKDTATVTITNDDTAGVTITPTTLSISEDGSATYTVVLDSKPADDVWLWIEVSGSDAAGIDIFAPSFTPETWDTPQTITVSGIADDDRDDESVTISHEALSTDAKYNGIAIADVSVTVDDTTPEPEQQQQQAAARTYSVSATATATEGSNATLTITLSEAAPTDGVAFTVTAGYTGSSTATSSDVGSITSPVTVTEGNSTLDISIPTADDAVDEDDETFTVTVAASASGWEKAGDGQDTATITITDDDTAGVTITPTTLSISEDGSATYTVVLDSRPTHDVTVTPTGSDGGAASFAPASYTFTPSNWNTPRTFTVSGVADEDRDDESVTISHDVTGSDGKYNGIAADSVAVSVADTTPPPAQEDAGPPVPGQTEPYNVQVTPGDGTLTVTWNVAPRDGVSNDSIRHALRWSQVSGVWANPQDPRGGGPEDGLSVAGGVTSYTITGLTNGVATGVFVRSFTGGSYSENAAASSKWVRTKGDHTTPKAGQQQQQQQAATPRTYSVSATATAAEGGNATLTITLSEAAPTDGVAFTVTAGYDGSSTATSSDVGSITSPVTVTGGNNTLSISIPTADDAVDEDDETFTITIAAGTSGWEKAGDGQDTATVTITDDDTAGVTVTPTTLSINEDGSATYTVVLNSKPTSDVTVTPTGSDDGAASFAPASYTFTPSNWSTARTFTVSGVSDDDRDDESVTISHDVTGSDGKYNGIAASSVAVSVADTTPEPAQEPEQATTACPEETEPPVPGQWEPYNICVTPGDGTLTVTWRVAPRDGVDDDSIRHALRWSQVSGVWANPTDPQAGGPEDGITMEDGMLGYSVEDGVYTYTITGLQNGVATGVFIRSFTGGSYSERGPQSSKWVRIKGENTTPRE